MPGEPPVVDKHPSKDPIPCVCGVLEADTTEGVPPSEGSHLAAGAQGSGVGLQLPSTSLESRPLCLLTVGPDEWLHLTQPSGTSEEQARTSCLQATRAWHEGGSGNLVQGLAGCGGLLPSD